MRGTAPHTYINFSLLLRSLRACSLGVVLVKVAKIYISMGSGTSHSLVFYGCLGAVL